MPRRHLACLLVLLVALLLATVAQAQAGRGSGSQRRAAATEEVDQSWEVLMEGGMTIPTGNLGDEFLSSEAALGAETGFTLGIRVRFHLSRALTVAPAFAYTEFGDYDGLDADGNAFVIVPRVLRYGLDFVFMKPGRRGALRPFAGAGAAFVRNKYREEFVEDETYYDAGVNGLAWSVQAGLRWRSWELVVDYQHNTFATARFLPTGGEVDYDWSRLALKLGIVLPGT